MAERELQGWRFRLHEVIFEADTSAGRTFDILVLVAIVVSVTAVLLESVATFREAHGLLFRRVEWIVTILFTIEYAARLVAVSRPTRYMRSFFGVVDLCSILPTYLSLVLVGTQSLLVIRALRLLRIFRVFKLAHFVGEASFLVDALRASGRKIIVFLGTVLMSVLIIGSVMYLVEGPEHGFTSIPQGVYWAIVTMTTVGYGDIAPSTVLGKFLASIVMIMGYGIIAVPTGIVTAEMTGAFRKPVSTQACLACSAEGHDLDARHCKFCGAAL